MKKYDNEKIFFVLLIISCLFIFFFIGSVSAATSYVKIDSGSVKSTYHDPYSITFTCKYKYLGTRVFKLETVNKFYWNTYQDKKDKNHLIIKGIDYKSCRILLHGIPSTAAANIRKSINYNKKISYYLSLRKSGQYLIISEIIAGKKLNPIRFKTNLSVNNYYWKNIRSNFKHLSMNF